MITTLSGLVGLGGSGSGLAPETSSPPGSDETDLLARGGVTADGGGMTNVLVVTSSMGMLHGVHGHTTHLRPAVPLHTVLVVGVTSLQHGLLSPTPTSNLTDHGTAAAGDNLLGTRGELDPGGSVVWVVADDDGVVAGGPGEDSTVADVVLDVADDGSLGDPAERKHVADGERGAAATVDELARVHALGGDEELLLVLVPERVAEGDLGERRAAARVVDDVGNDALEVPVALAEVEGAEPGGALAVVGVGLEDGPRTLTLSTDDATHLLRRRRRRGGGRGMREWA
jgi:hypothetical protein